MPDSWHFPSRCGLQPPAAAVTIWLRDMSTYGSFLLSSFFFYFHFCPFFFLLEFSNKILEKNYIHPPFWKNFLFPPPRRGPLRSVYSPKRGRGEIRVSDYTGHDIQEGGREKRRRKKEKKSDGRRETGICAVAAGDDDDDGGLARPTTLAETPDTPRRLNVCLMCVCCSFCNGWALWCIARFPVCSVIGCAVIAHTHTLTYAPESCCCCCALYLFLLLSLEETLFCCWRNRRRIPSLERIPSRCEPARNNIPLLPFKCCCCSCMHVSLSLSLSTQQHSGLDKSYT